MSRESHLASLLITFHLIAVTLAAIPDPSTPTGAIDGSDSRGDGLIASLLVPVLDRATNRLLRFEEGVHAWSAPAQGVTRPYVSTLVPQRWTMFSRPSTSERYLRVDYFVRSGSGASRVVRRLEVPWLGPNRVRLAYRSRDKAIIKALDAYLGSVGTALPEEGQEEFEPDRGMVSARSSFDALIRHLKAGLGPSMVADGESLFRLEIRLGYVPIPPPGAGVDDRERQDRLAALARYRDGAADGPISGPYARLASAESEAGITWFLAYVHEP